MFRLTWRRRGQIRRETSELPVPAGVTEDRVTAAGLLLWEEHCVECAAPQCCRSGSFYAPRADRRYARFVSGITPTPAARGRFRFGAEIQIRRWGKQEAIISAQPAMSAPASLRRQRVLLDGVEELASPASRLLRLVSPTRKRNGAFKALKRLFVKWPSSLPGQPVAGTDRTDSRIRLAVEGDEEVHVLFRWLHFVRLTNAPSASAEHSSQQPATKVKCVAWDLDNTLWQVVVGDAGVDGVSENPEMLQLIRELDERGILQSIAVRLQRSNQFNLGARKYDAASFQRTSVTGFARAQAEGSCQTGSWEIVTHPTLDERRVLMDHVERRPLKSRLRQTFTGIRLASFAEAGRQQWRTA